MTVVLNDGEVINSADATTGFNVGNISTDDDFVEGTGAIGLKGSLGLNEIYTTSLGAGAPYGFDEGSGADFANHIIMWFNTKTSVNTTTGIQIVVGNGTDRGRWNVIPSGFYKGGFITAVIDPARDFDAISAGTWNLTGNPGQLTSISEVGGAFTTLTSIMGNFNNIQLDQMTLGRGLRIYDGSAGSPNTFEEARAQDEDTSFWGWWSSKAGSIVGKGGLTIGPATGSVSCNFDSTAESIVFEDERVSTNFYNINLEGSDTDVMFDLISIRAADSSMARWNFDAANRGEPKSFSDTNGVWAGANTLAFHSASTLTNTTFIDCTTATQNSGTLTGISVLSADTTDGVAFLQVDAPQLLTNSSFEFSAGHAIELTEPGTSSFAGNTFTDYSGALGSNLTPASGSTGAAIYNNSGGGVTLNIPPGDDIPSVRNGAGSYTEIAVGVTHTTTGLISGSIVRYIQLSDTSVLLDTGSSGLGIVEYPYSYSSDIDICISVLSLEYQIEQFDITLGNSDATLVVGQDVDRIYNNP